MTMKVLDVYECSNLHYDTTQSFFILLRMLIPAEAVLLGSHALSQLM